MISERFERYRSETFDEANEADREDCLFAERIYALLNHSELTEYSYVDAYYYDYSALPEHLKDIYCRDMYLLFGITEKGEIFSKWVERYDLDSDSPIFDGKVIHLPFDPESNPTNIPPEISQSFDKTLLSVQTPDFLKSLFSMKKEIT